MGFYDGKKVLVTGGCGFIGSHLAEALCRTGAEVTVADNLERGSIENIESFKAELADVFVLDLRKQKEADQAVEGQDLVFHLAFKVGGITYTGHPAYFSEIWRDGTRLNMNVIEACRKFDVDKLLFTSSACVYPSFKQVRREDCLSEEHAFPAYPDDAYGWSKLVGELQCKWYNENHNFDSVIVRPFNVYGEREYLDRLLGHALPVFCRKAIEYPELPFVVHGDGSHSRSFVYVSDVVGMMLKAMEKVGNATPINVGTTESTSVRELVDKIVALSGKDFEPEYDEDYKVLGVKHRTPNLERAKRLLGWTPKVTLDEGLARTFCWVENYLQK